MTILSTITKQSFSCNGSLREFDFTFPAVSADDIKALILDSSGIETELAVTAQYSVTLNPDGSGGTLTTVATWATGNTLIVYRETEHTQETEYKNNQAFDQGVLTSDLDKATMMIQEVDEKVGRALKLKKSSALGSVEIADLVAGRALKVNSSGDGIDMGPAEDEIANAQANAEAAATARDKAEEWAEAAENVEVETGKYSAKHYSAKASESAAGVNLPSLVVGDANKILRVKDDVSGYDLESLPTDPVAGTAGLRTLGLGAQQACAGNDARLTTEVSDDAYAAAWDGVTTVAPSKNAVYDKIQSLTYQKARAYRNAAQSIPNGTFTKIAIDSTTFDPAGIVDTTNNRIKPTKAGYYQLNGQVAFLGIIGDLFCILYKDGFDCTRGNRINANGNSAVNVSDIIYFNGSTNYVELYVYQNSGAAKDLEVGTAMNYLSIVGPF